MTAENFQNHPGSNQTRKNVLYLWVHRVFSLIFPIVTTPIIANGLYFELVAVWFYVSQITSQVSVLDLGITNSLTRLLSSNAYSQTDKKEIFTTSLYAALAITLLFLIVVFFSARVLSDNIPDISTESKVSASSLLYIALFLMGASLFFKPGYALLLSKHRFDTIQRVELIGLLSRFVLIVIMFNFFQPNIILLGLGLYSSYLISSVIIFILGVYSFGVSWRDFSSKFISKNALAIVFSMSMAMVVISVSSSILFQGSSIISAHLIGIEAVTIMAISLMLFLSITPFFQVFATIVAPIASGISSIKQRDQLLLQYKDVTRFLMFFGFSVSIGVYYIGEDVFGSWLSGDNITREETDLVTSAVVVLFAGYSAGICASIGKSILSSVNSHWLVAILELSSSIVGIALAIFVISISPDNRTTDVISYSIAFVMASRGLIFYPIFLSKYFGIPMIKLLKDICILPISTVLTSLTIAYVATYFFQEKDYANWVCIFIFGVIQSFFLWQCFCDEEAREKVKAKILASIY